MTRILSFNINDKEEEICQQLDSLKEYAKNANIDEFSRTKIFSEFKLNIFIGSFFLKKL